MFGHGSRSGHRSQPSIAVYDLVIARGRSFIDPTRAHEFSGDCVGAPNQPWRDFKFLSWQTFNASVRHLCRPRCRPDVWMHGRFVRCSNSCCGTWCFRSSFCWRTNTTSSLLTLAAGLLRGDQRHFLDREVGVYENHGESSVRSRPQSFQPSSCRNLLSSSLASLPSLAVIVSVCRDLGLTGLHIFVCIRPLSSAVAGTW